MQTGHYRNDSLMHVYGWQDSKDQATTPAKRPCYPAAYTSTSSLGPAGQLLDGPAPFTPASFSSQGVPSPYSTAALSAPSSFDNGNASPRGWAGVSLDPHPEASRSRLLSPSTATSHSLSCSPDPLVSLHRRTASRPLSPHAPATSGYGTPARLSYLAPPATDAYAGSYTRAYGCDARDGSDTRGSTGSVGHSAGVHGASMVEEQGAPDRSQAQPQPHMWPAQLEQERLEPAWQAYAYGAGPIRRHSPLRLSPRYSPYPQQAQQAQHDALPPAAAAPQRTPSRLQRPQFPHPMAPLPQAYPQPYPGAGALGRRRSGSSSSGDGAGARSDGGSASPEAGAAADCDWHVALPHVGTARAFSGSSPHAVPMAAPAQAHHSQALTYARSQVYLPPQQASVGLYRSPRRLPYASPHVPAAPPAAMDGGLPHPQWHASADTSPSPHPMTPPGGRGLEWCTAPLPAVPALPSQPDRRRWAHDGHEPRVAGPLHAPDAEPRPREQGLLLQQQLRQRQRQESWPYAAARADSVPHAGLPTAAADLQPFAFEPRDARCCPPSYPYTPAAAQRTPAAPSRYGESSLWGAPRLYGGQSLQHIPVARPVGRRLQQQDTDPLPLMPCSASLAQHSDRQWQQEELGPLLLRPQLPHQPAPDAPQPPASSQPPSLAPAAVLPSWPAASPAWALAAAEDRVAGVGAVAEPMAGVHGSAAGSTGHAGPVLDVAVGANGDVAVPATAALAPAAPEAARRADGQAQQQQGGQAAVGAAVESGAGHVTAPVPVEEEEEEFDVSCFFV